MLHSASSDAVRGHAALRRLHHRLLAVAALAAAVAVATAAPAAHAGTYDVYSCKSPTGAPAPVADAYGGWVALNDDGAALQAKNDCAAGNGLTAFINRQGDVAYGAWTAWQFRAPTRTRLVAFDLDWRGWTAGDRYFGGHAYIQRGDGVVIASHHTEHVLFGPQSVRQHGLDIDHVNVAASCVSNPTCIGTGSRTDYVVQSDVSAARMTLRDDSEPTVAGISGSGMRDASWAGEKTFSLSAGDEGGGVYRAVLWVDGVPARSSVLNANDGRCADADPAGGSAYQFVHPKPCASSTSGTLTVDTRTIGEGTHGVRVTVEDAAGNHALAYGPETKVVDNIGAPTVTGAPVVHGTAASGRTLQVTPGTFDAQGGPAPTVSRVWQRCHSTEARCEDLTHPTGVLYDVSDADVGRRLRVVETARNSEGSTTAVSAFTAVVTRPDGTLPDDGNGIDDDGDGQVDEPGEQKPAGSPTGPAGPTGPVGPAGPAGANGSDGRDGTTTVINGTGASPVARLTARFRTSGGTKLGLPFDRATEIAGRLVDHLGKPISGATITVSETRAVRGAVARTMRGVVTGADGRFRYRVARRGPSRKIRFGYSYERGGTVVAQDDLDVRVRAATTLDVTLRGVLVAYRGRVRSAPLPAGGKLVLIQGRVKGGAWQTFASRRASRRGTFTGRYRLKVRNPGRRLQFRARVVTESGYPYLEGRSRTVTRTVR